MTIPVMIPATFSPSRFAYAQAIALADGATEAWQQILRTGAWSHPQYGRLEITAADLAELQRNFDAGAREHVYADYDHGIAQARGDGHAISAGEVKALELRADGTELWALYEPTERAAEKIRAKEYRFTSADFVPSYVDKRTGARVGKVLRGFALTNRPFIEGMAPLSLGDAAGPACLFADPLPRTTEIPMPLREKLGLPADATDDQVVAAVDTLLSDAAQATTLSESATASAATLTGIRQALQLAEDADPVPAVTTLAEQAATLRREKRERDADAQLDAAVRAGTLTPAEKAAWRAQLLHEVPAVAEAATTLLGQMPKRVPIGSGVADKRGGVVEQDPDTLLDEKVKELQAADRTLSYGEALVLAERALESAITTTED